MTRRMRKGLEHIGLDYESFSEFNEGMEYL